MDKLLEQKLILKKGLSSLEKLIKTIKETEDLIQTSEQREQSKQDYIEGFKNAIVVLNSMIGIIKNG